VRELDRGAPERGNVGEGGVDWIGRDVHIPKSRLLPLHFNFRRIPFTGSAVDKAVFRYRSEWIRWKSVFGDTVRS